jgi:pimeloyl-ACP methyl ester carboxylesterase
MKRASKTPPFLGPDGEVVPGSIAEAGYVQLGGLDQWMMIRGENITNPVLVVLHGGPGFSDTAFLRYHTPELEKSFTVVYWDQRGTGRSYTPAIPRSSMTVAQFMADLDQLVELVRRRLDKSKVAILGHSWGSALGVLYAARFPEKVAVYVGVAQVGDSAASEVASYAKAVAEAERQGNRAVLKKLRAIGAPPHSVESLFVQRTCAERLRGGMTPKALWATTRMVLGAPEASLLELRSTWRAFRFCMESMWPEVSRLNLIEAVPALEVPVVVMVGRRDPWIPAEISAAYFDVLRAPSKKMVWFDESGHEPFVDEPSKFVAVMHDLVRPLGGPAPALRPDVGKGTRSTLTGDDLLPAARAEVTHHVDIETTPERVWPWLVQMGRRRGGWYSWDLLDNGGLPSADRIVPELQKLAAGDILPIKAKGSDGFAVLLLDAPRALVLGDPSLLPGRTRSDPHAPRATWAFVLEPLGPAATRLHVRVRAEYERSLAASLLRPLVVALHDVMERKQLRTLKERVEAQSPPPFALS